MDSDSSPRSAYDVAAQLQHRRTASGQINMRKIDGWQTLANQVAAGDRIQLGSMLSPVRTRSAEANDLVEYTDVDARSGQTDN